MQNHTRLCRFEIQLKLLQRSPFSIHEISKAKASKDYQDKKWNEKTHVHTCIRYDCNHIHLKRLQSNSTSLQIHTYLLALALPTSGVAYKFNDPKHLLHFCMYVCVYVRIIYNWDSLILELTLTISTNLNSKNWPSAATFHLTGVTILPVLTDHCVCMCWVFNFVTETDKCMSVCQCVYTVLMIF